MDRSNCTAPRHGTASYFRRGCRCPDAYVAKRRYDKQWRAGILVKSHVDATGTRRRLQALMAIGHNAPAVAAVCDLSADMISYLRKPSKITRPNVHRNTAAQVVKAYELLSMTPGADAKARTHAARLRYAPPLAWDNIDNPREVPDLGAEPRNAKTVRLENVAWLTRDGLHLSHVARRLGTTEQALDRDRWGRTA